MRTPEGRGNTCGHIRCEAKPCQWHRPPATEQMAPGQDRELVRAQFQHLALAALKDDPAWALRLGRIASLDGSG